jgi:uncharacterized membrane protein YraQ (UPF0718 family)
VAVAVIVSGCLLSPARAQPQVSVMLAGGARAWTYTWSIVLEAVPYILAGAIAAAFVERFARRSAWRALVCIAAPGCDCSMNGFVRSLTSLPAPFAGALMLWGSACNPIALFATYQMLGSGVLIARIAGALIAALLLAALMRTARICWTSASSCEAHGGDGVLAHFERGVMLLGPAAIASGIVLAFAAHMVRSHASPLLAAVAGAMLSPCSTADPILARTIAATPAAQAAFAIASQCLDVRQLTLLRRCFGAPGVACAIVAGVSGCAMAAFAAR